MTAAEGQAYGLEDKSDRLTALCMQPLSVSTMYFLTVCSLGASFAINSARSTSNISTVSSAAWSP